MKKKDASVKLKVRTSQWNWEVRRWHAAFAATMRFYETAKGRSERGEGLRTSNYRIGVVTPQVSDFIADIEIAARSILGDVDLEFFKTVYTDMSMIDNFTRTSEAFRQREQRISRMLGREFIARKIHPKSLYFKEVDTRK